MNDLMLNYREFLLKSDSKPVTFFFDSGLCLDHQPENASYFHSHYHNEIFTVLKGVMDIVTDAGMIRVSSGETAMIPANIAHKTVYDSDIFRVTVAFLNPDDTSSPILKRLTEISVSDSVLVFKNPHLGEIMNHLIRYVHGDFEYKELLIEGCLTELMALVCQSKSSEAESVERFFDSKNYRNFVIAAIFEDAFSPIRHSSAVPTLKSVSEKLHLSEKQTERMIKSFFGRSFGEQVSYMRMTRAKELLETTDMKVNAISSAVGYSVTRSFFGAFKKTYGMTPNEYRKARKRDCI